MTAPRSLEERSHAELVEMVRRMREALAAINNDHLDDNNRCGICGSDHPLVRETGERHSDAHERYCPIRKVRALLAETPDE